MLTRIAAVLVILLFLVFAAFLLYGLATAERHATFSGVIVQAFGGSLDVPVYKQHWQVVGLAYLLASLVGLAAGVGLFLRKAWSLLALAVSLAIWVAFETWSVLSGFAKYAFEEVSPIATCFRILLLSLCLFGYWRGYPRAQS